ncbi:hypothetical protein LC613_34360 [Nostoc sphaeroides CHAB 2801]|uniref:hypothetical protein n=1 Tax=Nostoc sphaeroides TaxID=446679 RepID=UPI001E518F28|nr:hypothetical protein [Nostoc sphaeroides]MCC5632683.1 hypothetical protein [Nostoc sphaeroides CHAB 2801]
MEISVIGEKAIALFTRRGRSLLLCVQTTLWFSTTLSNRFGVAIHIFVTQSQWHLTITETGNTTYQATCMTSNTSTAVRRPAGNFLFSANPFLGCVPLAFSGDASTSVTHQAVTLDCAVKVRWALRLPKGNFVFTS